MRFLISVFSLLVLACVSPVPVFASAAEWIVVARCAAPGQAAPGKGLFEVRYKVRDGASEGIDIRGCGSNRAFRKYIPWGGDQMQLEFYALPFFEKGKLDFLIEFGLDVSTDYTLFRASKGYEFAFAFDAIAAPFFGDADEDGRWEIAIENLEEVSCADMPDWRPKVGPGGTTLFSADTLCRKAPEEPPPL